MLSAPKQLSKVVEAGNIEQCSASPVVALPDAGPEDPEALMMRQLQRILEVTRKHFEIDANVRQPVRIPTRLRGGPVRIMRYRSLYDRAERAR